MTNNSTEQFLDLLYGTEATGYLALWTLQTKGTSWIYSRDIQRVARLALCFAQRFDVYFGIGLQPKPLGKYNRGSVNTVSLIPGLWLDEDVAGPAHKENSLPSTLQEAVNLAYQFPLPPSAIVDSGHGIHSWWLFKEGWELDSDEERETARDLAWHFQATLREKATRYGWDIESTHDLARVLRLPGTTNRKLREDPRPVQILELHADRRYSPSDFEEYLLDTSYLSSPIVNNNTPPSGLLPVPANGWNSVLARCKRLHELIEEQSNRGVSYNMWLQLAAIARHGGLLAHEWIRNFTESYPLRCTNKDRKRLARWLSGDLAGAGTCTGLGCNPAICNFRPRISQNSGKSISPSPLRHAYARVISVEVG